MILVALQARVTDWKALQLAWHESCTAHRPRLVRRMSLYRNGHDASQVLVLIEYPDESAHNGTDAWQMPLAPCLDFESIEMRMWEVIEQAE